MKLDTLVFERLVESVPNGVLVTDPEGRIVYCNKAFAAITGYSRAESLGRNPRFLQSGRQDADFYQQMWATLVDDGQWQGLVWNRKKSGELYSEWLSISSNKDAAGETTHFFGIFADISTLTKESDALQDLVYRDALTGLPNRTLWYDRVGQAIRSAERRKSSFAVLFIDLDGFKAINDDLGHMLGDEVLVMAAQELKESLRTEDTVARIGGDEFAVLLSGACDKADVDRVASTIVRKISQLVPTRRSKLRIGSSIGVAFYPSDGTQGQKLMHAADTAMYLAKRSGGNSWAFANDRGA